MTDRPVRLDGTAVGTVGGPWRAGQPLRGERGSDLFEVNDRGLSVFLAAMPSSGAAAMVAALINAAADAAPDDTAGRPVRRYSYTALMAPAVRDDPDVLAAAMSLGANAVVDRARAAGLEVLDRPMAVSAVAARVPPSELDFIRGVRREPVGLDGPAPGWAEVIEVTWTVQAVAR